MCTVDVGLSLFPVMNVVGLMLQLRSSSHVNTICRRLAVTAPVRWSESADRELISHSGLQVWTPCHSQMGS